MIRLEETIRFTLLPPLQYPRQFHACVLLRSGQVLVAGGQDIWSKELRPQAEILSLEHQRLGWSEHGTIEVPRIHPRLFAVHGGCVFLVSGVTAAGDPVTEVEELHVSGTEGVIEWGVVSEVRGMTDNMTWAQGLCLED